jgi:alkanesulfonate monooxygenase SsuD/methylene tetrahydromethanopterin reductase-like flavin-dependent oxidoreductase (luciferase family)
VTGPDSLPAIVIAAAATRRHPSSAAELARENVSAWQALRQARETCRQWRTLRRRFRRDPASYLAKLEADFLRLILPL